MDEKGIGRRGFLTGSLLGGGAALLPVSARAREYSNETVWEGDAASPPHRASPGPDKYFTPAERSFVEAAVDRLIPPDDWPGAKELGVADFLDDQLAGPFGRAEIWYMQGPWDEGVETQGFQSRLTPAQMYRAAIKGVDAWCRDKHDGTVFGGVPAEAQDDVLSGLEKGDIELPGVDAKTFFDMFLQNTIEGFFGDPVHGGNRDMAAWKMIGFPGARYDYREYVKKHNQRIELQPVSVAGVGGFGPRNAK